MLASTPRCGRMTVAMLTAVAMIAMAAPPVAVAAEEVLTDGDGRALTAGEFGQGAVIVVFMASWSPRCRDVIERVNRIHDEWGARARVVVVNFQEDPAEMASFLVGKTTRAEIYYDRDGAFSKAHSITFLPGLLVLQNGTVAFRGRLGRDPGSVLSQILG